MTGKQLIDLITPFCNSKNSEIFSDHNNYATWLKIKPTVKKLITLKDDIRTELGLTVDYYRDPKKYNIEPIYLRWRVGRKTIDVCVSFKDKDTNGAIADLSILEYLPVSELSKEGYEKAVRDEVIRARLEVINKKLEKTLQILGALEEEKENLRKEIGI